MQDTYTTHRLSLKKISLHDTGFILALVNTPEWIRFIGDRNIRSLVEASEYIRKVINSQKTSFWVVKIRDQRTPIGIVTFIKRNYLDYYDIGFAFLTQYTQKGYAYEASIAILNDAVKNSTHRQILAITIQENTSSILLLKKLGLRFSKKIQHENKTLLLYSVPVDKIRLDNLTKSFFSIFTNINYQPSNCNSLHSMCLPETMIIKKNNNMEEVYNLNTFIEPRRKMLSDGTLTEFEEYEISEETRIVGNIAQRFSTYQKNGCLNGIYFKGKGSKLFQYVRTSNGWKINSIIWEDDTLE